MRPLQSFYDAARQAEILGKMEELEAAKKQGGAIQTSEQLLEFTRTIGRLERELEALEQGRLSDRLDSETLGRLAEAVEDGQKLQLNQRPSDVQVSQNAGAELQRLQLAAAWENGKLTEGGINGKVDKSKAVAENINNDFYSVLENGFADRENFIREAGRLKGKTTEDIQNFLNSCGYNTNFRKSKHSGSNAQIIQIFNNTSDHNITQVQISPGGGRHGPNPYYKISTTDQGITKIVFGDPKTYRTNGNEKAFIIFAEADLYD